MQKTRFGVKLISLILMLSFLISAFSLMVFANMETTEDETSGLNVAYNRTFDEGWDYDNGILGSLAGGNVASIAYELTTKGYNHFLNLKKTVANSAYVYINTEKLDAEGKTFIEFDLASLKGCSIGQAVKVSVGGSFKTLVEFGTDGLYVLGTNIGDVDKDMDWKSFTFVFDFDYAANTLNVSSSSYLVTAYCGEEEIASEMYNCGLGGFGVSQVRFFFGAKNAAIGSWYAIDNLKIYSGVSEKTDLKNNVGFAVDMSVARDYPLASDASGSDGFLTGNPTLSRDTNNNGLVNHYNRHYGEGFDLVHKKTMTEDISLVSGGHDFAIKSEKLLDGTKNYFFRFRARNDNAGFIEIPVVDAPDWGRLVFEVSLKAGVNADIGDIISFVGAKGEKYFVSIENGQLYLFGKNVGYIGNNWVHIVVAFDYEPDEENNRFITVNYGAGGQMKVNMADDGNKFSESMITAFHIGVAPNAPAANGTKHDNFGDWYGVDNLKVYSGIRGYATLEGYGNGVNPNVALDFDLGSTSIPDTPVTPDLGEDADNRVDNVTGKTEDQLPQTPVKGTPNVSRVEKDETSWIQYHRYYSEGWAFSVGGGTSASAIMTLENEQQLDLTYNYYQHYEKTVSSNVYWTLSGSGCPSSGKVFMEMDVRAVEGADIGGVIQMRTVSAASNSQKYLVGFDDGYLVIWDTKVCKVNEYDWIHLAFEFDYSYAMNNPTAAGGENNYLLSAWIGDSLYMEKKIPGATDGKNFGISTFRIGFEGNNDPTTIGQFWDMDNLKFYAAENFLNLSTEEGKYDSGLLIPDSTPKDFPIQATAVSLDKMIEESLFLKVGSDYMLSGNVRVPIIENTETGVVYGAPFKKDDIYWVPLDAVLGYLNYPIYEHEDGMTFDISTGTSTTYLTLGRNTASVGGKTVKLTAAPAVTTGDNPYLVVALADIDTLFPGYYAIIDDMNMIVFTSYKSLAETSLAESIRIDIMKDFLFDYAMMDEDNIYDTVKENTNNFDHPYLITNQERFDELHEVFMDGFAIDKILEDDPNAEVTYLDATLYQYLKRYIYDDSGTSSVAYYNRWAASSLYYLTINDGSAYPGLKASAYIWDCESGQGGLQHPWQDSAGYDPIGGRLDPPYQALTPLAFAYQVTRDDRFARLTYDYCVELVDWDHWGPGHFLNCADTATAVAIAYDWCYDAWVRLGLDTKHVADGIYYHGALQGYLVTIGEPDAHGRANGNSSYYPTMRNNWNAVCTKGVAAACLAIMDYEGFDENTKVEAVINNTRLEYGAKVKEVTTHTIAENYKTLVLTGIDIYAPDGSYEESVSYWSYGAGAVFQYAQILTSAMGSDAGIMDTWGLDRTCYSILHMVSSDFTVFAYNDGSVRGGCDSGYFSYVADVINDDFLRYVRKTHIQDHKQRPSVSDAIFYRNIDDVEDMEMPLQYHHVGIHGYTLRSSWEKGAIFAGLLGGDNDDGHGHIDAGQWVYYNKDIEFFEDIGPDGYNTYNYFSNNHMYKTTVEGHNVILLQSQQDKVPAGQLRTSVSPITETYVNEYGTYAITDTSPAFGGYFLSANRGIMLTNDRKTVIIQDEIVSDGAQTFWWIAHYNNNTAMSKKEHEKLAYRKGVEKIEISNSGRVIHMTSTSPIDKTEYTLRVQIVSAHYSLYFQHMTTQDYLLNATMRPGDSEAQGKQPEGDRSMWSKFAIKCSGLPNTKLAVVMELVDPSVDVNDATYNIGYRYTDLANWEPSADTRVPDTGDDEEEIVTGGNRGSYSLAHMNAVRTQLTPMLQYVDGPFGTLADIKTFYKWLTQANYSVNGLGRPRFESNSSTAAVLPTFDECIAKYTALSTVVHATAADISAITNIAIGAKSTDAGA